MEGCATLFLAIFAVLWVLQVLNFLWMVYMEVKWHKEDNSKEQEKETDQHSIIDS